MRWIDVTYADQNDLVGPGTARIRAGAILIISPDDAGGSFLTLVGDIGFHCAESPADVEAQTRVREPLGRRFDPTEAHEA